METLLKLGIDWQSILLYFINFGVLFLVLQRYAIPHILGIIDERRKTIEKSIQEATLLQETFQAKLVSMEQEKQAIHAQFSQEIEKMRAMLAEERMKALEEIEQKRQKMIQSTEEEIEHRKSQILKKAEQQTLDLIKKTILYVVQNKVSESVIEESIQESWKQHHNSHTS